MKNLITKYRALTFEQKTIWLTIIGLCASAVLACGKLVIGIFTDYNLISIALYTFALLLAKLECVLGVKTTKRTFRQRNAAVVTLLFVSSILYIGFTCRTFFIERKIRNLSTGFVLLLALISFVELGFAIAGLIRTKNKGHYYRNIKIINFCIALIAILTTQTLLIDMSLKAGVVDISTAYTGIGVGIFIAACAVYVLIAPKASVVGREHNVFKLINQSGNGLIDLKNESVEILLSRSCVYGSYVYCATVKDGNIIDGNIERKKSLWKRMNVFWKILCCILSEILIFVWLAGRLLFFFRSIDLPKRLERIMNDNGFSQVQ